MKTKILDFETMAPSYEFVKKDTLTNFRTIFYGFRNEAVFIRAQEVNITCN